MAEKTVYIENPDILAAVFGSFDCNIRIIEDAFGVRIYSRMEADGVEAVVVIGDGEDAVKKAAETAECLKGMITTGDTLSEQTVEYVVGMVRDGNREELSVIGGDVICITVRGKPIRAKTVGQKQYVEKIRKNTIVLGVGPAGTGKTFLAVAAAVKALRAKDVARIVLTRPAVEAGEKLGYLPGDLQNKIDPYLRPLYDALFEMLGPENYARQLERNAIEIAPLAYMRGRTLDDSFIILDEAQNTTPEQMKMFLTRLGHGSKAVVTGDLTQTDLAFGNRSGLAEAVKILDGIDDISIHRFTERDVVRHRLVQKIILAYEKYEKNRPGEDRRKKTIKYKRTIR